MSASSARSRSTWSVSPSKDRFCEPIRAAHTASPAAKPATLHSRAIIVPAPLPVHADTDGTRGPPRRDPAPPRCPPGETTARTEQPPCPPTARRTGNAIDQTAPSKTTSQRPQTDGPGMELKPRDREPEPPKSGRLPRGKIAPDGRRFTDRERMTPGGECRGKRAPPSMEGNTIPPASKQGTPIEGGARHKADQLRISGSVLWWEMTNRMPSTGSKPITDESCR